MRSGSNEPKIESTMIIFNFRRQKNWQEKASLSEDFSDWASRGRTAPGLWGSELPWSWSTCSLLREGGKRLVEGPHLKNWLSLRFQLLKKLARGLKAIAVGSQFSNQNELGKLLSRILSGWSYQSFCLRHETRDHIKTKNDHVDGKM